MDDRAGTDETALVSTYIDSVPLPPELAHEPWSEQAAAFRLRILAPHLPFAVPEHPEYVGGQSNDAWLVGSEVLRVCWRSDRGRLLREAHLLAALPPEIPHASVTAAGSDEGMSWILSPRLPGTPLHHLGAGDVSQAQVRDIYREVAEILEALHSWSPPPEVRDALTARPDLDSRRPMSVWAADLVPLPVARVSALVPLVAAMPFVDDSLIDRAMVRIESLARFDPFSAGPSPDDCVIHGDATGANVMVDDGRVTALIDFEHARMGPRDLELLSPILFGSCFGIEWWREDYPELFAGEHLRERVWLYELCCAVRQVIWWPPEGEQTGDSSDHSTIRELRRLVEAPTRW